MDLNKNYYSTLHITKIASVDEIKKSYRKLALQYHPDKNINDPYASDKFNIITEAYKILSAKQIKERYDRQSIYGKTYQPYKFNFKDFSGKTGYEEKLNLTIEVKISIQEIYQNTPKQIKYWRLIKCKNCNGSGFEPNDNWSDCLFCNSTGINNGISCKYCKGSGKLYRNKCESCNGEKIVSNQEILTINNTFLILDRKTIRYDNYGNYSKYFDNKTGTLIIFMVPENNSIFSRKNSDMYTELNVHFAELITGTSVKTELLDYSNYFLKIPPKTTSNKIFKISGKGFLKKNKQRGDLYIKVIVQLDYSKVNEQLIDFLNGKNINSNSSNDSTTNGEFYIDSSRIK